METIRFDDVDALNASASAQFGDWGPEVTVTQEMIDQFAALTGDLRGEQLPAFVDALAVHGLTSSFFVAMTRLSPSTSRRNSAMVWARNFGRVSTMLRATRNRTMPMTK